MNKNLRYAFITSIPVLFGYLFLGIAFGLLLQNAGYNFIWAFFISLFVYAGSGQFVLVGFLSAGASLATAIFVTLSVNCRHIFYGLSFIERFRGMGKAYPYMIFSLTDETYSLLCSIRPPEDVDVNKASFYIALLDHCYWILGSVLGAAIGQLFTFNTTGVDFAMTALFTVIFVEQWLSSKTHLPAFSGLASGIVSLLVFGPDKFLLPALCGAVAILLAAKKPISNAEGLE